MDRINTASKAVDLFGVGKHGWKNRNVATGVDPTDFNAEWCNGVQEEELAIIEGAGIVPDAAVRTQVRQAIKRMTGGNVTTVNFAASPFALTADHAGMVLVDAAAGNVVINLPAANVLAGLPYAFRRTDATANTVTVNRAGADTIDEGGTSFALTPKSVRQLRSNGVSAWSTTAGVSIGYGQTWQNISASRNSGVTYYNTTDKPIAISNQVTGNTGAANSITLTVDGLVIGYSYQPAIAGLQSAATVFAIVPTGSSYSSTYVGAAGVWSELR